eukprot:gene1000-1524_t
MAKAGDQYECETGNIWSFALRGETHEVSKILKRGVDVNLANKVGWTAAHAAASGGHVQLLNALLREGADVEAKDLAGRTPAHTAAQKGRLAVLKWLDRQGVDLEAADGKGATVYQLAQGKEVREYLAKITGQRRVPFSGKFKKEQLKAKRAAALEAERTAAANEHYQELRGRDLRAIARAADQADGVVTAFGGRIGGSAASTQMTFLTKENIVALEERRKKAYAPFCQEAHAVEERDMDVVVCLTKVDVLPTEGLAEAWAEHLRSCFPRLKDVVLLEAPRMDKKVVGRARWTNPVDSPAEACRQQLLRVLKDCRVQREHLAAGRVRDFFEEAEAAPQGSTSSTRSTRQAWLEREDIKAEQIARAGAAPEGSVVRREEHSELEADETDETDETDEELEDANSDPAEWRRRPYVTIGMVGEPNMGKSSVINRLFGAPTVGVSPTPGKTKHLQTHFLQPKVRVCDCPGLIFPKRGISMGLQVLSGNYPISQVREPYEAIRYLVENGASPPVDVAYGLGPPSEDVCNDGGWSPFSFAEALAEKWKMTTRGGRPDTTRAANKVLRSALGGDPVALAFSPPGWNVKEDGAPEGDN